MLNKRLRSRLADYARETRTYWRESRRPKDFVRLMRVRLSQSKVGPIVCRHPIVVDVDLASLGKGVRLRSHTTDIPVLAEVLIAGSYAPAAAALNGVATTLADLGANTGLVARWLLERFPHARLISVEPEPGNVAVLRHNLRPYGDRATVIAACIGARPRRVRLSTNSGEFGFAMTELADPDDQGDADVVTMDAVLAALGGGTIDFLKCDIEGAERELFATSDDWISQVRVMAVECHGSFSAHDFVTLLETKGVVPNVLHLESTPQLGCEAITLETLAGADDGAAPAITSGERSSSL
jgi:FkbM family methyltransferase